MAILELTVVAGAIFYIYSKNSGKDLGDFLPLAKQAIQEKIQENSVVEFPEESQPTQKDFQWTYRNQKYQLSLTLYQSIYEYYQNQPKKYSYVGALAPNWEEEYYGMFLRSNEKDTTILELAKNLQKLGSEHKLNEDQLVEMTLAFVQTIAYDDAKAKNILAGVGDETMLYPYETLFQQKGVCSDKSFLATVILRAMGYGTTLFVYNSENHMAIGVQCPKDYSNYDSGYCYGETTTVGNKIGIIPDLSPENNRVAEIEKMNTDGNLQNQQPSLKKLSQVAIFQATQGKQYAGIIATKETASKIVTLKNTLSTLLVEIENQKKSITKAGDELTALRKDLDSHQNDSDYEKYNTLARKYNKLLTYYKNQIEKYNKNIALYNKTVEMYNTLIRQ